MPTEHDRALLLSVGLSSRGGPLLLIDARDPSRLFEIPDADHLDDLPAGALVVTDGATAHLEPRDDGRLLVPRALLNSLLDPSRAGRTRLVVSDRLAAEQQLRREGRRFWAGLQAWAALDPALRDDVRRLLTPFAAAQTTLLDLVDRLAARPKADPFAAWGPDDDPPAPPGPPPAPVPDDPRELEEWMTGLDGLGRLYGPGFRGRLGQGLMAGEVLTALQQGRSALIEAGTGVGKTLAYLVPLLRAVTAGERRGVVSTHTRALQAQILEQDLPRLAPLFPGLVARRLMGRANYLCRTRLVRFQQRAADTLDDAWAQASFRLWLASTVDGLRDEVEEHPALRPLLGELFDSPEPCSPAVCYGRNECHVQRARRLAREAQLVVVNHALLMHDCAARHTLVGEYGHLVVDEAHRLPQTALETFSLRCDGARAAVLEELVQHDPRRRRSDLAQRAAGALDRLGEGAAPAAAAALDLGRAVLAAAAALRRWLDAVDAAHGAAAGGRDAAYQGRIRVYDRRETFAPVDGETRHLLDACAASGAAAATLAHALDTVDGVGAGLEEDLATLTRAAEMVRALEDDAQFLTGIDDEDWVVWLEPDAAGRVRAVGATRLDAGDLLREQWTRSRLEPVATSATLGIGEDFTHMNAELGLSRPGRPARTALVPSPFDYETQSLFLCPAEFPGPDTREHVPTLAGVLQALLSQGTRKGMVLFTSYRALQQLRAELQARDQAHEFRTDVERAWAAERPVVLAQGEGTSAAEMLARFRRERRALLLGTSTFWEGVDLPGDELELLVVPRLPFLVPTDPWVEARSERMKARGENPFTEFMVRDAVLRLRQGVGRLLRTENDRGVVLLLDPRLHGKPYGMTFLKALPVPVRYCAGPAEAVAAAEEFFRRTR
ncbi:MAG TPA: helicase C-terminal domain-containing protein [Candidatus Krumholzibacteria bacterium]|nr:helicase C-terminal domain-containing protein [Candidatus Krumholzibacteria bacterium]HRX50667.1 helicase C-terminal domain-containing protein [Candidatus Krumholzibacteria bacterium]